MLTGQAAFKWTTIPEILNKQQHEIPALPSAVRPDLPIPPGVEREVMRALEKDRNKRHLTALELADSLEEALLETNIIEPDKKESDAAIRWRQSLKFVLPAAAAMILLLLGLNLLAGREKLSPAPPPPVVSADQTIKLEYSIFRTRDRETVQLAATNGVNEVQPKDDVFFKFVMPFDGAFYLLYKLNGRFIWMNPTNDATPQSGRVGQELRVPETSAFPIQEKEFGPQNFVVVYVPSGNPWTLAGAVGNLRLTPDQSAEKIPDVELSETASNKLSQALPQIVRSVDFLSLQQTAVYRHEIKTAGPLPILSHGVTVNIAQKR